MKSTLEDLRIYGRLIAASAAALNCLRSVWILSTDPIIQELMSRHGPLRCRAVAPIVTPGKKIATGFPMDETKIDREAMGRLAKALAFICGADHPTTVALKAAAESGSDRDIKNARVLFLRLKQSDRRAALAMLDD